MTIKILNQDVCTTCQCLRGDISCFVDPCPPIEECESGLAPIFAEGHCCKICPVAEEELCKTKECVITVVMTVLLILLTILSITVIACVRYKKSKDTYEPVPRYSDTYRTNGGVSQLPRSPAIVRRNKRRVKKTKF